MSLLETERAQCPYCWSEIELLIDLSAGSQEYVEDCFVCCRPILVNLTVDGEDFQVDLMQENG